MQYGKMELELRNKSERMKLSQCVSSLFTAPIWGLQAVMNYAIVNYAPQFAQKIANKHMTLSANIPIKHCPPTTLSLFIGRRQVQTLEMDKK